METKQDIRNLVLMKRNQLNIDERREKSELITHRILQLEAFQEAASILCYASYRSEVETNQIANSSLNLGKKLYYPVVKGEELQFYRIHHLSDLVTGYQGIREPLYGKELYQPDRGNSLSFMIVPGCGFDLLKYRIGYGKGFYDRYLEKFPMIYTAMVAFLCQKMKTVLPEPHDIPMNTIITEETII